MLQNIYSLIPCLTFFKDFIENTGYGKLLLVGTRRAVLELKQRRIGTNRKGLERECMAVDQNANQLEGLIHTTKSLIETRYVNERTRRAIRLPREKGNNNICISKTGVGMRYKLLLLNTGKSDLMTQPNQIIETESMTNTTTLLVSLQAEQHLHGVTRYVVCRRKHDNA